MSHAFHYIVLFGKGCGFLKDLRKNFKTLHNGVTVVPWYTLYMTINNAFLSGKGSRNSILILFSFGLPSALIPRITSTLTTFILPIFYHTSYVSLSFSYVVSKISRHAGFWNKTRQSGRWRLELLPQMSRKDSALMLFLPLCICECLWMSQLIKMKWWSHCWYLLSPQLVSYRITDYSHLVVPNMVFILCCSYIIIYIHSLHTSLLVAYVILRLKEIRFHNVNTISVERETPGLFISNCMGHPGMAADIAVLTGRSRPPSMVSRLTQVLIYNWTDWALSWQLYSMVEERNALKVCKVSTICGLEWKINE